MMRKFAVAGALLVIVALPALAQAPPPGLAWARGTVAQLDGDKLVVKQRDGSRVNVALPPTARIQTLVKKTAGDIKPGDFVVSAGTRGKDGQIRAAEVRILPQASPDGGRQFAWDLTPNGVMTNATVATIDKTPKGTVLHVKFTGGETQYTIGPRVPVLVPAPADRALLRPGKAVFAFCRKAPDGGLTAAAVYVENNGVKPPM